MADFLVHKEMSFFSFYQCFAAVDHNDGYFIPHCARASLMTVLCVISFIMCFHQLIVTFFPRQHHALPKNLCDRLDFLGWRALYFVFASLDLLLSFLFYVGFNHVLLLFVRLAFRIFEILVVSLFFGSTVMQLWQSQLSVLVYPVHALIGLYTFIILIYVLASFNGLLTCKARSWILLSASGGAIALALLGNGAFITMKLRNFRTHISKRTLNQLWLLVGVNCLGAFVQLGSDLSQVFRGDCEMPFHEIPWLEAFWFIFMRILDLFLPVWCGWWVFRIFDNSTKKNGTFHKKSKGQTTSPTRPLPENMLNGDDNEGELREALAPTGYFNEGGETSPLINPYRDNAVVI